MATEYVRKIYSQRDVSNYKQHKDLFVDHLNFLPSRRSYSKIYFSFQKTNAFTTRRTMMEKSSNYFVQCRSHNKRALRGISNDITITVKATATNHQNIIPRLKVNNRIWSTKWFSTVRPWKKITLIYTTRIFGGS